MLKTSVLRCNTVNGSSIAMLKAAGDYKVTAAQTVPYHLTSNGFCCCQRSTCGISLIYHRPAQTDGLHYIVSIHNPQGHRWHHQCLIRLRSWIFMIRPSPQTMWWKLGPKFQWAYVVGYGSNYHPCPHSLLDIFWAQDHEGVGMTHSHLQGDHPSKWKYDADSNILCK